MTKLALSFLASAAAGAAVSAVSDIEASTPLGTLVGEDNGQFRVWRGIRYAEMPRRFQAAQPKRPWRGRLDAKIFGDACIFNSKARGVAGMSEDCLFMNIWTPSSATWPLPVIIFIHGGGFMTGSGSEPRFWGDLFADGTSPVVYVTFDYRMGILGFYSGDAGANFGIQDQQLALAFVRDNIAGFGGDLDRVTLLGQSAGAMSVQTHLVSPSSRGLFGRAILASTVGLHYRSLEQNKPFVNSAARAVGCLGLLRNQTTCMQETNAEALDAAAIATGYLFHLHSGCHACDNFLPWQPVIDGKIIPRAPLDMLRSGDHAKVPVIISSVRNESWAFLPGILQEAASRKLGYAASMKALFRDKAVVVQQHYAQSPDAQGMNSTSRLGLAMSDALFTCYARYIAKTVADASPVFLSMFMHAPSPLADPFNAALDGKCQNGVTCHAADLGWVFPYSRLMQSKTGLRYTHREFDFALTYSEALRAFAYGKNTSKWIPYNRALDQSLLWEVDNTRVTRGYHKEHCDFFESLGFPATSWVVSLKNFWT